MDFEYSLCNHGESKVKFLDFLCCFELLEQGPVERNCYIGLTRARPSIMEVHFCPSPD